MDATGINDWRSGKENPAGLDELRQKLADLKGGLDLVGLEGGSLGFVLARIAASRPGTLVVTPTLAEAEQILADVEFFLGDRSPLTASLYPPYAHLPFGNLPAHHWTVSRRIRCLWSLCSGQGAALAVVPIQALLHRTMPRQALTGFAELLLEGEEVERKSLLAKLVSGGYSPTALVEEPGDMAVRGGIVDIYGPLHDDPLRLEFFGDFVDSLRLFRPHDQRSVGRVDESILLPMSEVILDPAALERGRNNLARLKADPAKILALREPLTVGSPFPGIESFLPLFYEKTEGLWDYFPENGLTWIADPAGVEREAKNYLATLRDHQANLAASDGVHLDWEQIAFPLEEVLERLRSRPHLGVRPLDVLGKVPRLHFQGLPARDFITPPEEGSQSVLAPLVKMVRSLNDQGTTPYLVCRTKGQMKRLGELLEKYGLVCLVQESLAPDKPPQAADLYLILGALTSGFALPGPGLLVLTEEEALGQARVKSRPREELPPSARLASYAELNPDDLVVHVDHGVGRFKSLVNLAVGGRMGDFLLLEYKGDDKLYVPADHLDKIQKFAGPEGQKPALDRLGGTAWTKTKSRVRRKLVEIVRELVELYALRQIRKGFAFSGRDEIFREFEATFPFQETDDQARAIEDVIRDMAVERPMDRLICGDVGYGKTEVALRAAFKAVLDGKQVALLVPTTVLAEQHGQSFIERLAPYPVRVEVLSRFKTPAEQKKTLAGLEKGLVDVIIGTHRLLSKDVLFSNLGLVIIDEEHRFGVTHKERLKELRKTVDVLALTATPIPRTLQMSLLSIRDLSVINTPPVDRQSITTYISRFDPAVIQEAVGREMLRDGQVFFVHNRVRDIVKVANLIQKLVPVARVEVAHGQMSERVLEEVMHKFVAGEIDVLVCTTIIESGLDIPSANTIIINHADKLGLAQIYQLRGRVGRSSQKAYAYLLIPAESTLTRDAQKRLKVMMDFSHLGAGFQIAMHDLRIRGGGNLLGHAQSGSVAQVGYEMYLALMEQAVAELKGERVEERLDPEINLPFPAFIPAEYVDEPNQRLTLYRRLSTVDEASELEDLVAEMRDRFGELPPEGQNLIEAIRLKLILRRGGVGRLDVGEHKAVLTFAETTPLDPARLVDLVRSNPKRYRLTPKQQLSIAAKNPLAETRKVLGELLKG